MIKKSLTLLFAAIMLVSCGSKKKIAALEEQLKEAESNYGKAKLELAVCLDDRKKTSGEIDYLKSVNYKLLNSVGDLSTLSKKEAENLERSLESLKERDKQISTLRDAVNRRDSVMLALMRSLKGSVGMDDEDITIDVEKGVVFVSLSDRFLFKSGSYDVNSNAKNVLGKVAKILADKPEFDVLIEGHTDNKAFTKGNLEDNWDLSVKRATALARILQTEHNVAPSRITAAGRGEYLPIATNDTKEGRSANRRTRIYIIPKLDQFYEMIEEEMKKM